MKKLATTILAALIFTLPLHSQDFEQGDFQVKAGIGAPNWGQLAFNVLPNGNIDRNGLMIIPEVKAEYFIHEKWALGISYNYMKTVSDLYNGEVSYDGQTYKGEFGLAYQRHTVTMRAEFHPGWFARSKIDLYAGIMAGVRIKSTEWKASSNVEGLETVYQYFRKLGLAPKRLSDQSVKQRLGLYAGVQFPVAENVGLYFESGIGKPLLAGGIKFNL